MNRRNLFAPLAVGSQTLVTTSYEKKGNNKSEETTSINFTPEKKLTCEIYEEEE